MPFWLGKYLKVNKLEKDTFVHFFPTKTPKKEKKKEKKDAYFDIDFSCTDLFNWTTRPRNSASHRSARSNRKRWSCGATGATKPQETTGNDGQSGFTTVRVYG